MPGSLFLGHITNTTEKLYSYNKVGETPHAIAFHITMKEGLLPNAKIDINIKIIKGFRFLFRMYPLKKICQIGYYRKQC
jgi:hypothetical protein